MTDAEQHLLTIFSGALDRLSEAERSAYLAETCGADTKLRARVGALLKAHEQAGQFLAAEPGGQPADAETAQTQDAPAPAAGALGVRLGGPASYRGIPSWKEYIGLPQMPLDRQAYAGMIALMYLTTLLMAAACIAGAFALGGTLVPHL